MIRSKLENPKGLHGRYRIEKLSGYKAYFPKTDSQAKYGNRAMELRDVFDLSELEPGQDYFPQYMDVEEGSEYFVMRLDEGGSDINHIKACRIGIHAYADAIEATIPQLAADLRERYPLL